MSSASNAAALAALAYAIINEQEGRRYYLAIAHHVRDEMGRRMFLGLAHDEEEHYRVLAGEYQSLLDGGGWISVEKAKAASVPPIEQFKVSPGDVPGAAIPEERLFPDPSRVIPGLHAGSGDREALELALKAEERGFALYRDAYERADDPNARAAYRLLMEEENRHHQWLQRSLEYLEDNNTYWDDTEFPFFTG
ncbi:MAG: ferritin family protein [Anaerolineae bacterium]|nr:ferritin family protein [Anaerolineae bacterium]